MIRVLHVIDKMSVSGSGLHGIARALEWWCSRLDKDEYAIKILSLRGEEPEAKRVFDERGIDLHFVDLGKFSPKTYSVILGVAREFQADLLHLHGYAATNFGRLAAKKRRIPAIVHEHVVFPKQPLVQDIADRLLAPLTTAALAISAPVAEFMREKRHIPANKLETFFYGMPFDEWLPPSEEAKQAALAHLQWPENAPILVTAGRLAAQKDLPTLIHAFRLVREILPDARLLIVGEGPERQTVEKLVTTNGLGEHVVLTGFQSDVRPWMAIGSAFVVPSVFEGGPLTLFEAMRLGIPTVSTPVGIVPEAVHDGENGYIVPCGDAPAMSEAIVSIIGNPVNQKDMAEKAYAESENWDVDLALDRLHDFYRRVLEQEKNFKAETNHE